MFVSDVEKVFVHSLSIAGEMNAFFVFLLPSKMVSLMYAYARLFQPVGRLDHRWGL